MWIISSKHTVSLLLSNLVPEEQLTEFVESKDHMIILKVFKEFSEKEEVILPALYSLHALAGPCKCIIESYFQFLICRSVHQLTSVCGNLSVIVKNQWELFGSCQRNYFSVFFGKYWFVIFHVKFSYSAILIKLKSLITERGVLLLGVRGNKDAHHGCRGQSSRPCPVFF